MNSRTLSLGILILAALGLFQFGAYAAPGGNDGNQRTVSIADAEVQEGDAGTVNLVFRITRTQGNGTVHLRYRTEDGTAVAGLDYVAASGQVTIPARTGEQTIKVEVRGDTLDEDDETLKVVLSDAEGATISRASAVGTIRDDDASNLLRIGAAKRDLRPAQAHIDGVEEARLGGAPRTQKFNLGGFGLNPTQSLPNPADQLGEALTQPAEQTVFAGSHGEEPIHLRVMIMEPPEGERVAFVTLDAIGAGNLIQDGVKNAVAAASCELDACIAPENILFGQTHTHAGPDLQGLWGGVPEDWIQNVLYARAAEAATEALQSRVPARLMLSQGQTVQFNNYRRPRLDPDVDADGTLTLLRAVAEDGTPVGAILQYNAHPTSINENPRIPHADYIQGAMDWLEDTATGPGGVALYYNGPIADASPSGGRAGCERVASDLKYGEVRCRGEGIAAAALGFTERELAPTITADEREVVLPITNPGFLAFGALGSFNRYYDFLMLPTDQIPGIGPEMKNLPQVTPAASTLISRITIGGAESGLEIVTIPGEATNSFGQYIRRLAQTDVMLLGLTHNSFGYIIPEEEFSYVDQTGGDGLVAPFTGYEENVSLGPLTAPLLRNQGYNPLFGQPPEQDIPPTLSDCLENPDSSICVLQVLENRLNVLASGLETCFESGVGAPGCPLRTTVGFFSDGFEAVAEGLESFAQECRDAGGPEPFCGLFSDVGSAVGAIPSTGTGPTADDDLVFAAAEAQAKGCDVLDSSHCLFPFPNDHFTTAAPAGSPQSVDRGGTGRRVNFNPLSMPRNALGKPIDPTEWNRNDGFSPGQMIVTYVPGLAAEADGRIRGAVPITDLSQYDDAGAPVLVLDAETGERHPAWAEIDLTASTLLYVPGRDFDGSDAAVPRPGSVRAPLIIRPAVNFKEGHRYVVVLRSLIDDHGRAILAGSAFGVCRDGLETHLPPVRQRCEALEENVFPVLERAGVARDGSLYLAWDFTVGSTNNQVARLRHMRDDAFVNYLGDREDASGGIQAFGRAPKFDITEVVEFPANHPELVREIKGTFTVPSYVVPADPSPADGNTALRELINRLPPELQARLESGPLFAPIEASSPPNRLYFNPADGMNPDDPQGSRFGDGLPDRSGELSSTFTCRIARSTLSNKPFAEAAPDDVQPARASLYGHGLLGDHGEINQDQLRRLGNEQNMMFCATDWFGFASGDLPNVLSMTVDMSSFAAIPDGTQQGILNQMFLARLLRHPQGFAAHPAFRVGEAPVFDHREVFYDGNSQGGITGGVVVALSKDVNRGALGVPGMNYSTLLTRSVDFDLFSVPIYLSYPDELDRNLIFSMIQMLWDRSENNGYAHHMTDNAALRGPDNEILLHTAFGDHQVTMWSADVMARTIGARVDRSRIDPARHPDEVEYFGIETLDYGNPEHAAGSGHMLWDAPWTSTHRNCAGKQTIAPPIGNVPPREEGTDPHECPRREAAARCQKGHFLHGAGRLIDVGAVGGDPANCPSAPPLPERGPDIPVASEPDYGSGILGAVAQFMAELNAAVTALLSGDADGAQDQAQDAGGNLGADLAELPDSESPGEALGTDQEPDAAVRQAASANREVEPVVLTGDKLVAWSVPAAAGAPYPYPSGAGQTGDFFPPPLGATRSAHNGIFVYPQPGAPMGLETSRVAAYRWTGSGFEEVPVQVDERFPYFLANNRSDFSFYSGTDEELSYEWDVERWDDGDPLDPIAHYASAMQDPVTGLDHDDEVIFMARDAGTQPATPGALPADPAFDPASGLLGVTLNDPLKPEAPRFIYLGLKKPGVAAAFAGRRHYVNYDRDSDADQWIDRYFYDDEPTAQGLDPNPDRLGSSNTGYGPNRSGKVQPGTAFYDRPQNCTGTGDARICDSTDRFPRDSVTVTTDTYLWRATGRWMVRDVAVAKPDRQGVYGPDLLDRWKGRAFQQSPDSSISLVGFEDEQVNWEANSTLLGERCGPVRCLREIWGADSGTNVTKTETFYRDAVAYRYRVRVHPIPPDGLYTSWDYNRGSMISSETERAAGVRDGRYYTALRPQGVPIDGINDDVGQIDGFSPIPGLGCPSPDDGGFVPPDAFGRCPAFFDTADPSFNLPLSFDNWEQVSGKGDSGSLVYTFEMKGATSLFSPLVVPYYRDDACLDDGTGDDPVQRPWPGEASDDIRVRNAYAALAGKPYEQLSCAEKQGAHGAHGVHYFFTGDTDNNFVFGKPNNEIDGQQWQFMVPTAQPANVAEPYANVVRMPLQPVVVPLPGNLPAPG